MLMAIALVAGAGWLARYTVSHGAPSHQEWAHTVHVLTYNTHRMGMYEKPEHNAVIQYIIAQDADIVCLQEVEVYQDNQYLTLGELREALAMYPYCYFGFSVHNYRRQFGNVIFSKYPILDREEVHFTSRANSSCRCDIVVGEDTLRLINNHLESNRFEAKDWAVSANPTRDEIKQSANILSHKWYAAHQIRMEQAQEVRQAIEQSPYPVVVVGDFNDLSVTRTYRTIAEGLHDCFLESSIGRIGNTYEWHHIGMRIDYILCSPELAPVDCRVDTVSHSDHYPLHATIGWN